MSVKQYAAAVICGKQWVVVFNKNLRKKPDGEKQPAVADNKKNDAGNQSGGENFFHDLGNKDTTQELKLQ